MMESLSRFPVCWSLTNATVFNHMLHSALSGAIIAVLSLAGMPAPLAAELKTKEGFTNEIQD